MITPATATGPLARPRDWWGLSVLSLAVLIIAIDATVLDVALPRISESLRPSGTQLLWIIDVYSFVLAGLLVTMGTLGDRIGRRRLLLIGAFGFGAASLLAAWSTTPAMLITARVLQGAAGATLMPATLGLIRSMFPDARQRTTAIAIWSAMAGGGAAAGPLLGGWLLEHFWWGSVFLINIPVMAVLLFAGPLLITESRDPHPGRFDLVSAALSIVATVALVYAVKESAVHGLSPYLGAIAALGAGAGAAFVWRQQRLRDPMLDLRLFRAPGFATVVVTDFLAIFALAGVLFFGSQYLQAVLGYSPLTAGLLLLPGAAASAATALLTTRLRSCFPTRWVLAGSLLLSAAGMALLAFLPVSGGAPLFVAGFVLAGSGIGVALTVSSDVVVSSVPTAKAGAASAVAETSYELGTAMGVALIGSVVMSVYRAGLDTTALSAAEGGRASETVGGAVAVAHEMPSAAAELLLRSSASAFTSGAHWAAAITAVVLLAAAVAGARLTRVR